LKSVGVFFPLVATGSPWWRGVRGVESPRRGRGRGVWGTVRRGFEADGLDVVELEVAVISEEQLMDIKALQRQGLT
jgi:hypothetical protein